MLPTLLPRRLLSSASPATCPLQVASWFRTIYSNSIKPPYRQFSASPSSPFSRSTNVRTPSSSGQDPVPYYSPHQPKRQWPPDISKLSPKHQFRLERKYRRRAAMKWERPRWKKWTKIVQYGLYGFILTYALFYIDWGNEHPVTLFRDYITSSFKSVFSASPSPEPLGRPDGEGKEQV